MKIKDCKKNKCLNKDVLKKKISKNLNDQDIKSVKYSNCKSFCKT